MGNQPAIASSSSYVFAMWVLIVLIILIYSTFLVAMWWYYRQIQIINNWQDAVGKEFDSSYEAQRKVTQELLTLTTFVNSQADKTKTNLQLIADKINEMNDYYGSTEAQTMKGAREVVPPSPVVRKEAPKEIVEGNETLPNNVIQFPGPKKPN